MEQKFILNHHDEVPEIRETVKKEMQDKGYSSKQSFSAALLIDELSNNALEHGSSSDEITLEVEISTKQAVISCENGVDDPKINADYLKLKISKYEHHQELRGRGLSKLAPHYANELKIEDSSKNRIRVTVIIYKV
jgi:anti-sigma regulatory factor (Ser/Thr protein kinase)